MSESRKTGMSAVISVWLMKGCYRHIRISLDASLEDLHKAILDAFGFENNPAHVFFMDDRKWSRKEAYCSPEIKEAERFTEDTALHQLHFSVGRKFKHLFHFVEEWFFQCRVLKLLNEETGQATVIKQVGDDPSLLSVTGDDGDEDEEEAVVPKPYGEGKLRMLYAALNLPEETVELLHDYFDAFANLYGILPLSKALEIYNSQNEPLSKDVFIQFAEIVRHEEHIYYILGEDDLYTDGKLTSPLDREIIDSGLVDLDDDYEALKDAQSAKPYYIPGKRTLLLYAEDLYLERTKEFCALRDYLRNTLKLTKADYAAEDLQLSASMGDVDLNEAMKSLERMGAKPFDSMEEIRQFASLYMDMSNNTRMALNRGHTPLEIVASMPEALMPRSMRLGPNISGALQRGDVDIDDFRKGIWETDFPNTQLKASLLSELDRVESEKQKVGRNQPCPCGSGKKYKNCCGKVQ